MNYKDIYDDLMSGSNELRERFKNVVMHLQPEQAVQHKMLKEIGISQATYTRFMAGTAKPHMVSAKRILNWLEKKEKEMK